MYLTPGESCKHNSQCANNKCGRETAIKDAPTTCCPDGTHLDNYGGYDYCSGMPTGSKCWSNAMCKNGNCKGGSIFGRGTCN